MAAKKTVAKKTTAAKKTPAKKTPAKQTTTAEHTAHVAGSQVGDPAEGLVAPAENPVIPASIVGRSTGEKRGTVARYTTQGRQTVQRVNDAQGLSLEEVATLAASGKMGSGRDRDDALRQAGHDPAEVSKEMAKQAKADRAEPSKLPIPKNRRGSSWM